MIRRTLDLGTVALQSGQSLPSATLSYVTLGSLNATRDNAVVMPTYFTGQHWNYTSLIGPGRGLDPHRYFIVIPDMFGNGLSTSPSHWFAKGSAASYPLITVYDNVIQQARLLFDHLRVEEIALVCGWSLGGMQAYQWAVLFPREVRRLLPFGATARTSTYNFVFLEALKASLRADVHWRDDACAQIPTKGLRAFVRIYLGWAYSEVFFREQRYRELGFPTLEALFESWDHDHLRFSANDLMAMLESWQCADVGACEEFAGDTRAALRAIEARTMLLPCSSDRYFSVSDSQTEAMCIRDCEVRVLDSPFGHCALSPGKVARHMEFLEQCLVDLLSR
jgi:homoserine O-acetyltransferase